MQLQKAKRKSAAFWALGFSTKAFAVWRARTAENQSRRLKLSRAAAHWQRTALGPALAGWAAAAAALASNRRILSAAASRIQNRSVFNTVYNVLADLLLLSLNGDVKIDV